MEENFVDISNGLIEKGAELDQIIRVIGVGGAGGSAVNNMYNAGIAGVNCIVCNTDLQALKKSPVPTKVQIGKKLTRGLGAGSKPEKGQASALEDIDEIKRVLDGAVMVFVTAGMGGGTGTGAAPVIAQTAMDMGILTIGVVSIPYECEGSKRITDAVRGIEEMEKHVDALLIVNSSRLVDMYGDLKLSKAMAKADECLAMATRGISDIITGYGIVNVDFADVDSALRGSGAALIGTAQASGPNRALEAVKNAINSPLLNYNRVQGAKRIIVNMASSEEFEITQSEMAEITNFLRKEAGFLQIDNSYDQDSLIWGAVFDESLGEAVSVTVVATGFSSDAILSKKEAPKVVLKFDDTGNPIVESEEDSSRTITFDEPVENSEYTEQIGILYDKGINGDKLENYSTRDLCDVICVSMEDLRNEETISNIEAEPAFIRRKAK